jgi:hypothetical protein
VVAAWLDPREVHGAVSLRETVALLGWVGAAATLLRSFARSRGESICEARVSRTLAEPMTMDLGRSLLAAVLSGLRVTACVVIVASGLGGPTMETGLVAGFKVFALWFVADTPSLEAAALGEIGVVRIDAVFWKGSSPRDRINDSCTLNISSCIDERRWAGVPKLFDRFVRPGLEGVKGDENDGVVAVFDRKDVAGEAVVIGDGSSWVRRFSVRATDPVLGAPIVAIVAEL